MRQRYWIFGILLCLPGLGGACSPGLSDGGGTTPPVTVAKSCRASSQPLSMKVKPLSPYVYERGDGYAYFDVWIEACPVPGQAQRPPMDISLVIDNSGSMASYRKIANARAAGHYLLSQLGPQDRLSLVTYNTSVTLRFPLTAVTETNRRWMSRTISGIYTNGLTNLGGGLSQGIGQLQVTRERNAISRVILISDGLANVGVVSTPVLSGMAAGARQRRVSTTTMGVGVQFNELLLQSLAEYGGGRYHYIANANQLTAIFRSELQGMQSMVARNINVDLEPCHGCRVVEVPGYAVHRKAGRTRVTIRDLGGGQSFKALVKVKLPTAASRAQAVKVRLAYEAVRPRKRAFAQAGLARFQVTRNHALVRRTTNQRVAGRVLHVQASQANRRAMKMYARGDQAGAARILRGNARRMRAYARRYKSKRAARRARRFNFAAEGVTAAPPASRAGQRVQKSTRYEAFSESAK